MTDQIWFTQAMCTLRAGFPEMFGGSPDEWDAVCAVWHARLGEYGQNVLARAFHRIQGQRDRRRFPTLPEMLEVADEQRRSVAAHREHREAIPPERQLGEDLGEYSGMTADEAREFVRAKLGVTL